MRDEEEKNAINSFKTLNRFEIFIAKQIKEHEHHKSFF